MTCLLFSKEKALNLYLKICLVAKDVVICEFQYIHSKVGR